MDRRDEHIGPGRRGEFDAAGLRQEIRVLHDSGRSVRRSAQPGECAERVTFSSAMPSGTGGVQGKSTGATGYGQWTHGGLPFWEAVSDSGLERDRLRLTSTSGVNHPLKQRLRP